MTLSIVPAVLYVLYYQFPLCLMIVAFTYENRIQTSDNHGSNIENMEVIALKL